MWACLKTRPWEQQEHESSRRIVTLVNELAGEVRNGHKQVVVLGAAPGARAMGVSTPAPGGRVVSGRSGLVPLEVIKAKAALHVSDWDLDDVRCLCESGALVGRGARTQQGAPS